MQQLVALFYTGNNEQETETKYYSFICDLKTFISNNKVHN